MPNANLQRDVVGGALAAALVALVVWLGVWSTWRSTSEQLVWDEKYAIVVIEQILETNWRAESTIDYDDTKGPVFFWLYAGAAELVSASFFDLRFLTGVWFVIGAGLLGALAGAGGLSIAGSVLVGLLYALVPGALVPSQLVMSETLFVLLSIMAGGVFVLGEGTARGRVHRWVALGGYVVLMVLLLHVRVHGVALGAAICFSSMWICGTGCLRWWGATMLAGLLRLPLMIRWGGLVGESFQDRYGLGLRLDSLTYLAGSLVPIIGVFVIWALIYRDAFRSSRLRCLIVGGAVGAALGLIAAPDLSGLSSARGFAGPVAALLSRFEPWPVVDRLVTMLLAGLGTASLAVVLHAGWGIRHDRSSGSVLCSVGVWTVGFGWLMYALARGDVYDRYLLAFCFFVPIVMMRFVDRWLIWLVIAGQAMLAGYLVWSDLIAA